ncbi:MAG: NAD-dependent epimerase/dehydratase family protein [Pseudomonadota bacterium]|nr:NAD-dependent epimerase/dehydratase family protein [Pseudomonadota bacterium]MDP1903377.1 NAD-dependent epimerase/dehydratase family protein [Pseudomonadota bacterium]MDP2352347.1 NAD-dependent epimerase/dehydratase family protein [Pseudomonadota bacterium]
MNRRVMLLGGSGFIGTHLTRRLLEEGIDPVVVDWVRPSVAGVEYHAAELRTVVDLTPALLESVEAVYLLAWTTKPQAANQSPAYDLESNVFAGLHFLDGLRGLRRRPRVIFVSTGGAIYGAPELLPTPETACARPIGAYGIGKLAFEHYLDLYQRIHGIDYLVVRPGNPYGEGQDPAASQGAVGVFLGRLARGEAIHIWGDGQIVRDYLYIRDLAEGLRLALDYHPADAHAPRIFNLGSGAGVSLNELIARIEVVTETKLEVSHEPARSVDVPAIVLDCARANDLLGWKARTTLDEGLARTWDWVRDSWARA